MGLFKNVNKNMSVNEYENKIKPTLAEKDGLVHVVMITSFSKFLNQNFGADDKYSSQLDHIITQMQKDGYEIVDMKLTSMNNEGLTGDSTQFQTMIMYK